MTDFVHADPVTSFLLIFAAVCGALILLFRALAHWDRLNEAEAPEGFSEDREALDEWNRSIGARLTDADYAAIGERLARPDIREPDFCDELTASQAEELSRLSRQPPRMRLTSAGLEKLRDDLDSALARAISAETALVLEKRRRLALADALRNAEAQIAASQPEQRH